MPTTTIRLPDELKARVAAAAERAGTSTHGFILEAIAEKTAHAERQDEFDAEAEQRYAKLVQRGETIAWAEMRRYLETRVRGEDTEQPAVRKLAR